jgi:hypothetical protein
MSVQEPEVAFPEPPARGEWAGFAVAFLAGAAGWLVLAAGRNSGEGWDNPLYFSVFLPALIALAFLCGFLLPARPWRWTATMFGAQALVAFAANPSASLLPLGLIVFAVIAVPCLIAGHGGSRLRKALGARQRLAQS